MSVASRARQRPASPNWKKPFRQMVKYFRVETSKGVVLIPSTRHKVSSEGCIVNLDKQRNKS